jgi:hypothetical protein
VADRLVVGIANTSDPAKIEEHLAVSNIEPTDKLAVITNSHLAEHDDSPVHFIHPAGPEHTTTDAPHEVITGGEAILTTTDGTQVPNISADSRYMGFFAEPRIVDFMEDFEIPDSERQNYNEAIAEGRSVVVYKAAEHEAKPVEESLREAGLKNVRTY